MSLVPDSAPERTRVLVLSKDRRAGGGVANFVTMLVENPPPRVEYTRMTIGKRPGERGALAGFLRALLDSIRLFRTVRSGRVDVVQLNASLVRASLLRDGLFMAALTAARFDRSLLFFHGWDSNIGSLLRRHPILRYGFRIVFGRASRIIVLSSAFQRELVELGVDPARARTSTTMFDGALFHSGPHVARQRGPEDARLLFLSRLVREKGIYETVEAFDRLRSRFPGSRLVMAGEGPEIDSLRSLVRRRGLEEIVDFPGYVEGAEKAQALLQADVFVLPSYREGCPISLLEAMAAGLPIVAAAVGGILDIVREGVNGLLVPPGDSDALSEAVARLLKDPDARRRMGETNREEAWSKYEAARVTARIEELYQEIVADGSQE